MNLRFASQFFFASPPGSFVSPTITDSLSQAKKHWEHQGANDLTVITVANRDDAFVRAQLKELGVTNHLRVENNAQADYAFITKGQ